MTGIRFTWFLRPLHLDGRQFTGQLDDEINLHPIPCPQIMQLAAA